MAEPGQAYQAAEPGSELPPSMQDRVPFLLYRAAEASHALANQMLAQIGLTARQAGILTLITESGPMTQKALGTALRIDRTTMVALVDDHEARGLADRRRHPRDRRAFLVTATPLGQQAKTAAIRILDHQQQRFLAPLGQQDRLLLADLLRRLYQGQQDQ